MGDILVYSEDRAVLSELTAAARGFATELGLSVSAAALGGEAAAWAAGLAAQGADRIFTSDDAALDGLATDVVAEALVQLVAQASAEVVLIGSTRRGRELAGRLAQRLDAGAVTDANSPTVEDGALVAGRYAFGGATVQRERVTTPVKVFAVMPRTFEVENPTGGAGDVVPAALTLSASPVRLVERRPREGGAVDLTAAERIVGVGRGLSKREDVALGEKLASALEAELTCTKSLADFQWMDEGRVVGLSGAKTAPQLYLAIGISGQVQHTVGISSARVIAAVNTDKEAPIFQLADYVIVGDLYEVVPALVEKLGG